MKKPAHLNLKETVKTKRIKGDHSNFEIRKKQYEELKELRQKLKQRKVNNLDKIKKERTRLKEKKKRKEINDLKSGKFEIIKNPAKIKKWKKKARQMLQKIPPEIFYENFGKR